MGYLDVVLADSPAGVWPLVESAPPFRDLSGNGRDSTGIGSTPLVYANGTVTPDTKGVRLPGVATGFVDLNASAISTVGDFSLEIWARFNSVASRGAMLGKVSDANTVPGMLLFQPPAGGPQMYFKNGGGTDQATSGGAALVGGLTYHVVGTVQAGVARTYVNAALYGAPLTLTISRINAGSLRIGGTPDSFWGGLDGWAAWAAVYSTALSAARVSAHFVAGQGAGVTY